MPNSGLIGPKLVLMVRTLDSGGFTNHMAIVFTSKLLTPLN